MVHAPCIAMSGIAVKRNVQQLILHYIIISQQILVVIDLVFFSIVYDIDIFDITHED